jgi:hypothetical protein
MILRQYTNLNLIKRIYGYTYVLFRFCCAVCLEVRNPLPVVSAITGVEIVTVAWFSIIAGLTWVVWRMKNLWESRKFADGFAMMTNCTALIFVPFGLS